MSRASLRHRFRHQSPNLKIARKQRRTGAGEIECREITPTSRDSFRRSRQFGVGWTKLCRYLSRPPSTPYPGFAATGFTAYRRKAFAEDYLQPTANRILPCRRRLKDCGVHIEIPARGPRGGATKPGLQHCWR